MLLIYSTIYFKCSHWSVTIYWINKWVNLFSKVIMHTFRPGTSRRQAISLIGMDPGNGLQGYWTLVIFLGSDIKLKYSEFVLILNMWWNFSISLMKTRKYESHLKIQVSFLFFSIDRGTVQLKSVLWDITSWGRSHIT